MESVNYNFTENEDLRDEIFEKLSNYWEDIAVNIYEWHGLEEFSEDNGLTSETMEQFFYEDGKALFFDDINLGKMCLKCIYEKYNVYKKPIEFRAIGNNYSKHYDTTNSVLIKNNATGTPTKELVDYYVSQLVDIELTKQLRRNAHKTPYELECSADTLLSAKNYYKKIQANEPAIYKNKARGDSEIGVNVIDNDIDYINDKLDDEYNSIVGRILTLLGLDNFVEDKAERVQSAEVESHDEYINASFRAGLEVRKKACEKINKMFGTHLSVDYVQGEQVETSDPVKDEEEEDIDE